MAQDSSLADFWETRYINGATPWDAGRVPARLEKFLAEEGLNGPTQKALIPGCGSGYEVAAFAEKGFNVTAIDFSETAVERAKAGLGKFADHVKHGDFFAFEPTSIGFDLIYERTFLCALPRRLWPDYAKQMASLIRPGGQLIGFFFFDNNIGGPPFGLKAGELKRLLLSNFALTVDEPIPAEESLSMFAGKERWQAWRRHSI